ncbi:MAG: hypothetical protein U0573_06495 [Phycisphaerales bacterium]|nr:hypothetical protein [Planctomycetota bacterium]
MHGTPVHLRSDFRTGITLIECAGAALILGLLITTGLRAAAQAGASQAISARSVTGTLLAESLMNDILLLPYADPAGGTFIGIDSGESAANKSTFDDVDDFDQWTESPPTSSTGTTMAGFAGWTRSVRVYRASLSNPDSNSGAESGLKRIEVTVKFGSKDVCKLTSLRSAAS